jgi:serine/threonine protein kinase
MYYAQVKLTLCRDLKPENILVSKDLIKIGDFGIAKIY